MISPKAIELMIKHWDAVDVAVSKRVSRKRPWSETALTSLLCDLLDSETQGEIQLKYTLAELNRDLTKLDGILTFTIEIETMEYPPKIERWVNQSDLGFYIQYRDQFIPKNSWEYAFLCQAKRLYPSNQAAAAFDESSRFQGFNYEQHNRIKRLHDALGEKIVHYLLYCPRPIDLDDLTRKKLAHLRNQELADNIFDYTLGLFLREELSRSDSSLAAGVFISDTDNMPKNLGQVHRHLLQRAVPFSWFLGILLQGGRKTLMSGMLSETVKLGSSSEIAKGIVRGDPKAIDHVIEAIADLEAPANLPGVLPGHTVKIGLSAGSPGELNPQVTYD